MRVKINDGQEITFEDLNRISQLFERNLHERVLRHLVNRKDDAFFLDSFFVDYVDPTHVSVRAGLGVQLDSSQVSPETTRRLMFLDAASTKVLTAADPTNPRLDIVCVKAARTDQTSESRQVKNFLTEVVAPETVVTQTDWLADVQVVAGTPAGSPVAPATPAGYIKIATISVPASTGPSSQSDITDNRTKMPILDETVINTASFSNVPTKAAEVALKQVLLELDDLAIAASQLLGIYDAIVGSAAYCTHSTISSALAAVSAGARILVVENQTINTTLTVNKDNIEIELKNGVTISKGTATTGISVENTGFSMHGGRIGGFSATGDKAINFTAGGTYGKVWGMRQYSNDTFVDDTLVAVAQFGNIDE